MSRRLQIRVLDVVVRSGVDGTTSLNVARQLGMTHTPRAISEVRRAMKQLRVKRFVARIDLVGLQSPEAVYAAKPYAGI